MRTRTRTRAPGVVRTRMSLRTRSRGFASEEDNGKEAGARTMTRVRTMRTNHANTMYD